MGQINKQVWKNLSHKSWIDGVGLRIQSVFISRS